MDRNKLVKKLQSSSTRNSGAEKVEIQKSATDTSLLSPTTYKTMGKHTRRSQPLSAPIPSAPSPPQSSSPTTHVPPTTSAHSPQPSSPQSPSLNNVHLEEGNIFSNNDSQPKPKGKKRGMTQLKGLGIQDNSNAKIEVGFNEKGQPIGDASIPFASFIGALAHNKVPITVDDWRDVSSTYKMNIWTFVLLRYKLDEMHKDYVFQKMATSLREYRCQVGSAAVKALKLDEAEKARKLAMIKPENLTDNQ